MDNKSKALEFLRIPRASFYYQSILEEKDKKLKTDIENVWVKHPGYGGERLAIELGINEKRIRRVMRKFGLRPPRGRRRPRKSRWNGSGEIAPNLLVSLFPLFKNHVWVTDFTYLKWRNRWVYVATVVDLFTREVLGVSIKTCRGEILVAEALLNALMNNPSPSVVHSDQGSEYKARLFKSILEEFKILPSMSKKKSPWQNGYQESFYSNWKVDIGDVNRFRSLGELTAEIYRSIYYYNNERIHTSLGTAPKKFARQSQINYNQSQEKLAV